MGSRPIGFSLAGVGHGVDASFYRAVFGWHLSEDTRILGSDGGTVAIRIPDVGGPPRLLPVVEGDPSRFAVKQLGRAVDLADATLIVDNIGAELVVVPRGRTLAGLLNGRPYLPSGREPGRLSFLQLNTPDSISSLGFYREAMGWKPLLASNEAFTYSYLADEDQVIAGVLTIDDRSGGVVPGWQCYVHSDDVTHTTDYARSAGATVLVAPTKLQAGAFSVLRTPAGSLLAVDDMARDELLP